MTIVKIKDTPYRGIVVDKMEYNGVIIYAVLTNGHDLKYAREEEVEVLDET